MAKKPGRKNSLKKKDKKAISGSLERRIAELEDREAIRSLVSDMNWMADEGHIEDLLACFTDDLVYDVGPFGKFEGKPAVRAFYEQVLTAYALRIHYGINQVVELRGSKARSRCYWKTELELGGRAITGSGHYLDELVKQGGRWKVATRTAKMTYLCPLDEGWAKTRMMTLG